MTFLPSMHVVFPTEHVFTNYRHSWHNWFSQPMTWRTNDLLVVRDGRLWRTNTDDRRLFHATKFEAETDPSVIRLNLTDEYERQTPFRATRFQLMCVERASLQYGCRNIRHSIGNRLIAQRSAKKYFPRLCDSPPATRGESRNLGEAF